MNKFMRSVVDALATHDTDDLMERRHLEALRALTKAPEDATRRDHWDPGHFTASAFVVSPDHSALLLINHRKLKRWLQPGGHIEPTDETLEAAARREVAEETGVYAMATVGAGLLDVDVHEIPAHCDAPAHLHHDLRMAFIAETWELTGDEQEVAGVQWFSWQSLADDDVATDASVRRAVERLKIRLGLKDA